MENDLLKKVFLKVVPPFAVAGLLLYYSFSIGDGDGKAKMGGEEPQEEIQQESVVEQPPDVEPSVEPVKPEPKENRQPEAAETEEPQLPEKEAEPQFCETFSDEIWQQFSADEWLKRFILFLDEVGNGCIPMQSCGIWHSEKSFSAEKRQGRWYVSQASIKRYSLYVELLCKVDAHAAVGYYRAVQPKLDGMLAEMGYVGVTSDALLKQALETFTAMPLPESEPALVRQYDDSHYTYQDAELEKLMPVQKLCLRMGLSNAKRIQAKMQEFEKELKQAM